MRSWSRRLRTWSRTRPGPLRARRPFRDPARTDGVVVGLPRRLMAGPTLGPAAPAPSCASAWWTVEYRSAEPVREGAARSRPPRPGLVVCDRQRWWSESGSVRVRRSSSALAAAGPSAGLSYGDFLLRAVQSADASPTRSRSGRAARDRASRDGDGTLGDTRSRSAPAERCRAYDEERQRDEDGSDGTPRACAGEWREDQLHMCVPSRPRTG